LVEAHFVATYYVTRPSLRFDLAAARQVMMGTIKLWLTHTEHLNLGNSGKFKHKSTRNYDDFGPVERKKHLINHKSSDLQNMVLGSLSDLTLNRNSFNESSSTY